MATSIKYSPPIEDNEKSLQLLNNKQLFPACGKRSRVIWQRRLVITSNLAMEINALQNQSIFLYCTSCLRSQMKRHDTRNGSH